MYGAGHERTSNTAAGTVRLGLAVSARVLKETTLVVHARTPRSLTAPARTGVAGLIIILVHICKDMTEDSRVLRLATEAFQLQNSRSALENELGDK